MDFSNAVSYSTVRQRKLHLRRALRIAHNSRSVAVVSQRTRVGCRHARPFRSLAVGCKESRSAALARAGRTCGTSRESLKRADVDSRRAGGSGSMRGGGGILSCWGARGHMRDGALPVLTFGCSL
ncbi:hypothetical protein PLESTB_001804900 [Pleodorina starrii]|uniref:Uncharacterized protein n=1 Tax=Pleodorina starrii TaxID=330485 RepID=A0A9W6C122_9CHLO|nr:hypothetical protein PLESTM_002094000 [Pleodorina starrii]GLC61804.1 hypothetical protein PLESTB_001804900 [Pleodorina starrii]